MEETKRKRKIQLVNRSRAAINVYRFIGLNQVWTSLVCLWVTLDLHDCFCLPKNQSITNFQEHILQIWGPQMRLWGVKHESVRHHSRPGVSVGQLGQNSNLEFQGLWLKYQNVSKYILRSKDGFSVKKKWTFSTNFVCEISHLFGNLFEVIQRKYISNL